ncbi:MAG: hypothetical protein A2Y13_10520 [Planctomycetes bacterium GWC2_45_44]|nr:MAG: hypothetical protein A2Y13_10520 [Planctomycetes bacterium GWC2_45_44]
MTYQKRILCWLIVFISGVQAGIAKADASAFSSADGQRAIDIASLQKWAGGAFANPCTNASPGQSRLRVPFSFKYNDINSDKFLDIWEYSTTRERTERGLKQINRYKDPNSGLVLECEIIEYADMAAVDYVCYLTNTGDANTPIIEQLMPLDTPDLLEVNKNDAVVLRWSNGDDGGNDSFLWHDEKLSTGVSRSFSPIGGRSSNRKFPFFNLKGTDGGWIIAVGWTGQWKAEFVREANHVSVCAGMEKTCFYLRPGERVRTPRIVMLRWTGQDMMYGHNQFRQLMLKYYIPRQQGQLAVPPIAHTPCEEPLIHNRLTNELKEIAAIRKLASMGAEAYWADAVWFPHPFTTNAGNWYCRPEDFPRGLRPLADEAHRLGRKFILWFEPERVYEGTEFDKQYPEFLLRANKGQFEKIQCIYSWDDKSRLINLGNPDARKFITEFIDRCIKKWQVDVYRQDFNIEPLRFWKANDTDDRQGVTEMKYIEGLYIFWSDLLKNNPGLTIDNCASGGRRIDIETCSMSYPLWRCDRDDIAGELKVEANGPLMAMSEQVMFSGLALYVPFQGGQTWDMHPYTFRSAMASGIVLPGNIMPDNFPSELARAGIEELKGLRPFFEGDIYPLMKLTIDQDAWYAYQLDRPDMKQGYIFFFRRLQSDIITCEVELHNIDSEAQYMVSITPETYKMGKWKQVSGGDLKRIRMTIEQKPGSALLRYKLKQK